MRKMLYLRLMAPVVVTIIYIISLGILLVLLLKFPVASLKIWIGMTQPILLFLIYKMWAEHISQLHDNN